jgi:hypothetical protein
LVDAEESCCAFPCRRDQPAELDSVKAVRIAFGQIAPRCGGPAHGNRRDTERAVIEVKDVGVEAEGVEHRRIHEADSAIRAPGKPAPGQRRQNQ